MTQNKILTQLQNIMRYIADFIENYEIINVTNKSDRDINYAIASNRNT